MSTMISGNATKQHKRATPPAEARRIVFPAVRQAAWAQVALPPPEQLGPTEALVRAVCTLVSAGTEIAIYSGGHIGFSTPGATYPRLPFQPGYAFAGTVEAVGSAVERFRPGDRVGGTLLHTDWMVVDTARSALYPLPDGISFEQGCLARLAAISMQGVRLAQLRLGERAVVFGQGLIGQFARQLLALDGASAAIGVDLIDARLEVAQRDGATQTINPSRQNVVEAVMAATQGHGADVVIEATGNPAVINDALAVAARLGRVVLLGSPRGRVEIDPYNDIHRKGVSLIGAHANTAALPGNPYQPWTMAEQILLAVELMRQGRLRTEHLITHRVPAEQALGIFDALTERQRDHLGVIIEWQ